MTRAPVAAPHQGEAPHVDHQVAVAEGGASLGHAPRRWPPPSGSFSTGSAHLLRRHPLSLLHVDGFARWRRRPPAGRSGGRGTPGSAGRRRLGRRRRPGPDSWTSVSTGRPVSRARGPAPPGPSSRPGPRGEPRPASGSPCRSGLEDRPARSAPRPARRATSADPEVHGVVLEHAGPGDEQEPVAAEQRRAAGHRTAGGLPLRTLVGASRSAPGAVPTRRAATNAANSGCGRVGRDFSSGWNCAAMNKGCSGSSMISTRPPSGDVPENQRPCSASSSR